MMKPAKNTICLWYNGDAEDAVRFHATTFPDSSVGALYHAPGDFPSGKQGDVLTVEFTVLGVACLGLNGGPAFKLTEAFAAMMQMSKIDIAAIEAARRGKNLKGRLIALVSGLEQQGQLRRRQSGRRSFHRLGQALALGARVIGGRVPRGTIESDHEDSAVPAGFAALHAQSNIRQGVSS